MANKKIKGLILEIGGDTTGLNKAFSETDKAISKTSSELKDINRLLKLDPTNTELLEQKQKVLANSIADTTKKLDILKEAETKAQEKFKNGDISAEKYRELKREIIETENSLQGLETQAGETKNALKTAGEVGASALNNIENAADKAIEQVEKVDKSSKISAGTIAAGNLMADGLKSIGSAAISAVNDTREYRREIGYLKTNAEQSGESFDLLENKLNEVTAITNDNGAAIEGFSNLLQAGFSKDKLNVITDNLVGASIKWKDTLKFEGLADGLQETLATGAATGAFGEMLERMGMNLDDFNAKLAECTTQAEKQDLVLNTLADSGLVEAKNEYEAQNKSLIDNAKAQADLNSQMAEMAEKLEPILTKITQFVVKILEWTENNPELTITILAITAALAGVAVAIGTINAVTAVSPITWIVMGVVAAITLVVSAIVLAIKHFDKIKVIALDVWEKIAYGCKVAFWGIQVAVFTVINLIIKYINLMIKNALTPINLLIKAMNLIPGVNIKELQFKIKEIDIPEMPKLALGGSVMVGEAGPEVLTNYGNRVQVTPLTGNGASHALGGTLGDVVSAISKLERILKSGSVQNFYIGGKKVGSVIKPEVSSGLASSTSARRRAAGYA